MSSYLVTLLREATLAASVPRRVGRSRNALIEPGIGNGRFKEGSSILELDRAGTTGIVTIYGADASDPNGNPNQQNSGTPLAQESMGDGSTVAFQTQIPFVAFSNFNWITTSSNYVLAGTVAVTAGSSTITGTATSFLAALTIGDTVLINGEIMAIEDVQSDTVAIATRNYQNTAAGVTISTIGAPLPSAAYTISSGTGANALNTLAVAPLANVRIRTYFAVPTTMLTIPAANSRLFKTQVAAKEFMWTTLSGTPSATSLHLRVIGR